MAHETALTKRQLLEARRSAMETYRSPFISLWQNLNDYILPTRGQFYTTTSNRGDRRSKKIIDSTATIAARTLSSGMMSGITSPARPWFHLTTPDPELAKFAAVKDWLFQSTEIIRGVLLRSNFYRVAPLAYQDMGVFATAGVLALEDDHTVVRFVDFPVGSFCLAVDENNRPSVFSRSFRMSIRQLVARFGIDKVTTAVSDQYKKGNVEAMIEVVHFVQPAETYDVNALYAKDAMPWQSCYYEVAAPAHPSTNQFLRESGFNEFPGMFPRWEVTGEDVYGTNCPGITALGDVSQLQQGEKLKLQAVEKMVKPPMVGPTALKHVRVSTLPSDITYVDVREGMQGFRPAHEVRLSIAELDNTQLEVRNRIDTAFFANLFLMLSYMDQARDGKQPVTAAEIHERHEEKLLALGPVLEQLNQDFLDPIIDRVFNVCLRRGFIPDPPPELEGMSLRTEYLSMMHQAQKSTALQGFYNLRDFALSIAEIDPSVMDKLNTDRMIEHVADAAGVAPDAIVPQDEVLEIRRSRAEAQQQKELTEQAAQQADAAKKLSETDTTQQSALTDLAQSGATNAV